MKKIFLRFILLFTLGMLTFSCTDAKVNTSDPDGEEQNDPDDDDDDDDDDPDPEDEQDSEAKSINQWIFNAMNESYYWNSDYTESFVSGLDFESNYTEFFSSLLHAPNQTYTDSEAHDGYIYSGVHYPFSSMGRYLSAKSKASSSAQYYIFGISFSLYAISGNYVALGINYVVPGSPADLAGITRDDWIMRINGTYITTSNYTSLYPLLLASTSQSTVNLEYYTLRGIEGTTNSIFGDSREADISSVQMLDFPALKTNVITPSADPSKKIGYILYNSFSTNENDDFTSTDFVTSLTDSLQSIYNQNVTDLVVDLRYNLGGYLNICQNFVSKIAGSANVGQVFCYLEYLAQNQLIRSTILSQDFYFNLDRVYVLVSSNTASASETFINSLRGLNKTVTIIGTQTYGKNVASTLFDDTYGGEFAGGTFGGYQYYLEPIVYRVLNAQGECNFANGFTPDYYVSEFTDNDERYPLGNENELLFSTAIDLITGQSVVSNSVSSSLTRSGSSFSLEQIGTSLGDNKRTGAVYIPE